MTMLDGDECEAALVTRFSRRIMDMTNNSRPFGLLLLILACSVATARAQSQFPPLQHASDFAALGKIAAASKLPIMLVFTLPDCPYCARAKKDHLEPLSASPVYGAKVLVREIDTASDAAALRDFDGSPIPAREFFRKYEVRAVPTVIVVDAQGKLLADVIVGLNVPDFYNLYLEQAIDVARAQLRMR
jgi:thioredoxin-related protein